MRVYKASKLYACVFECMGVRVCIQRISMKILFAMLLVSKFYELTVISQITNKCNVLFRSNIWFELKEWGNEIINKWTISSYSPIDLHLITANEHQNRNERKEEKKEKRNPNHDNKQIVYMSIAGSFGYMLLP